MNTRSILIGAYEMKRPYQMNLLVGFGISYLLILAFAIAARVFIPAEPVKTNIVERWPGEISIIPKLIGDPTAHHGISPPANIGAIPVPVSDDIANPEISIPDQIQLASWAPKTPVTDLDGGVFIDTGKVLQAAFPPIDSFFPVDEQPIQVTIVQPQYPELARRSGIKRKVFIKALVDIDGNVKKAVVANHSDSDIGFESAAIEAALKSTWKPAVNNGQPVAVWVTYVVDFRLK